MTLNGIIANRSIISLNSVAFGTYTHNMEVSTYVLRSSQCR